MDPIQPQTPSTETKKNLGPIIAIVVVIILLVIAGLYIWGEKLSTPGTSDQAQVSPTGTVETGTETPLSAADDVNTIEAELNETGNVNVDLSGLE